MKVTRSLPFNMTGRSVRCLNVGLTSRVPVRPASHQDSESTVVIVRCSSNHGTEDNDDCGANRPAPGVGDTRYVAWSDPKSPFAGYCLRSQQWAGMEHLQSVRWSSMSVASSSIGTP